jgi:flagellar biosynthetic protein FlhB
MVQALSGELRHGLLRMGQTPMSGIGPLDVASMAIDAVRTLVLVCGPVALASIVAVVGVQTAQGGWVFAPEALSADWSRLNPAKGLKRLGFSQGGIELIKAVVASSVLAVLAWQVVGAAVGSSGYLARLSATRAAMVGWGDAIALLRNSAIALLAFAAADYGVQWWRFMQQQRMTKQEVIDDHRLTEGNPETKGRVRRIQRDMIRKRMLSAVPRATVVVTNPTHYAVALEYRRAAMSAPVVVAKGRNLVAERIKEIAREHGVPLVENRALARALFKTVEVGDFIPASLFEAVAEVLAYLIKLRQLAM